MTWRIIARSEVGTSHVKRGLRCDDDNWFGQYPLPTGELLAAVVADGAGSADRGGEGARLAVEAVESTLGARLKDPSLRLDRDLAEALVAAAHESIASRAQDTGLHPRDYACTLLGALSSPGLGTLVFQVGDGGIALDTGQGLNLAVVPMAGEYANMTHFVTQEDYLELLAIETYTAPATRVAAFTDGLQSIALDLTTNQPHEPFFRPFFETLSQARSENEDLLLDQLTEALSRFLEGPMVIERTDDDKTLLVAVWLDDVGSPALSPDDRADQAEHG